MDTHFANLLLICLLAVLIASFDAQKLLIPMKQYPFLILLPVPYYKVLLEFDNVASNAVFSKRLTFLCGSHPTYSTGRPL